MSNLISDGFYEITYPDGTHHRTLVETYYGQQRVLIGQLHMQVYMWFPLATQLANGYALTPLELTEAEQAHIRALPGKPPDEIWRNLGYEVPLKRDRM